MTKAMIKVMNQYISIALSLKFSQCKAMIININTIMISHMDYIRLVHLSLFGRNATQIIRFAKVCKTLHTH